jgi:hypothetical protein
VGDVDNRKGFSRHDFFRDSAFLRKGIAVRYNETGTRWEDSGSLNEAEVLWHPLRAMQTRLVHTVRASGGMVVFQVLKSHHLRKGSGKSTVLEKIFDYPFWDLNTSLVFLDCQNS